MGILPEMPKTFLSKKELSLLIFSTRQELANLEKFLRDRPYVLNRHNDLEMSQDKITQFSRRFADLDGASSSELVGALEEVTSCANSILALIRQHSKGNFEVMRGDEGKRSAFNSEYEGMKGKLKTLSIAVSSMLNGYEGKIA